MNSNKIFPLIIFLISLSFYGQGENMREKKEQVKAMKVAFLTTELNLSSAEAEKFWPIYNAFEDQQFELRHQRMKSFRNKMDDVTLDNLSEKEASIILIQMQNNEEELFNLRKKLVANLKSIIPSVKILKLGKAEENFNRKLLQQYRDKAHNR